MTYLVDSSCFMTASRVSYPFDIAKSFWSKLTELAIGNMFRSIDKVETEIKANDDDLTKWCAASLPQDFFITTETEAVYEKYAVLANWAQGLGKKQKAVDEFIDAEKADIYLVALSCTNPGEYVVVTEEKKSPESKKTIKLPDVCEPFGIRCINFIKLLRELQVTF